MAKEESSRAFLEVDESIISNNLKLQHIGDDGNMEPELLDSLFPEKKGPEHTVKRVVPLPGFCIKTLTGSSKKKMFINVCHAQDIPAPRDLKPEELEKIYSGEDLVDDFLVPVSIGAKREDLDKKGELSDVYDIAINTDFFKKVETCDPFRHFLILVISEALADKYKSEVMPLGTGYMFLKHRKAMGTIEPHNIEIRKPRTELIQETGIAPPKTQFSLAWVCKDGHKCIMGKFYIPKVLSSDIKISVGEDRVLVEAPSINSSMDVYIPLAVDNEAAYSIFDCQTDVLTIIAPLKESST